MYNLPPLFAHLVELTFLLGLSAVAMGAGLRLLSMLGVTSALSVGERFVFSIALGYGVLGFSMLTIGLAGFANLTVGIAVLGVLAAVGFVPLRMLARELLPAVTAWVRAVRGYENWLLIGVVVVSLGASLIKALAPVATQDDLMYHLALPKRYIEAQRIDFYPDSTYSLFPQLMEMLYSWGLLLGSDRLAILFAWSAGLMGPAGAALFAKRHLARMGDENTLRLTLLAPAIYLSVPLVGYVLRAANTDLAQASFDLLALYAIWLGVTGYLRNRDGPHKLKTETPAQVGLSLFLLAGVCSGLAFSTKYYGFVVTLLLGIALIALAILSRMASLRFRARMESGRTGPEVTVVPWTSLFVFGAGAALPALPWLIRNVVEAGNPIWPLGGRFFGGAYWSDVPKFAPETLLGSTPPLSIGSLWTGLEYLWYQSTRPPLFIDGQIHNVHLGFLLLPALFLLPFVQWRSALVWITYSAGGYWIIWALFFSRTSVRYLSTFFLLAALLGAYAIVQTAVRWRALGQAIAGVVGVVFVVQAAQAAQSTEPYMDTTFALSREAEQRYLSRFMEDYSVIQYIAEALPNEARIYVWDGQPRGYYIPRGYVYARLVPLYTGFGQANPEEWRARLAELDISHILVHSRNTVAPGQRAGEDPLLAESLRFAERYFAAPLLEVENFALYELK